MHVVDILPTFASLAGASTDKCKALDGLNVWPAIQAGKDSGREEIVYNIEPFRGAVRQGDWKLIWTTLLPGKVELYNIASDPNETKNVAADQPELVAKLKGRIEALAQESVKPLFFGAASEAVFSGVFGPAPIPTDEGSATSEP